MRWQADDAGVEQATEAGGEATEAATDAAGGIAMPQNLDDVGAMASEWADYGMELARQYAPALVLAVVWLIVGLFLIRVLRALLKRAFRIRKVDPSLESFLLSLVGIGLKLILFVSVLTMVGVQTSSFVAIIGAAGLAVGLALSGTLQNFAGGVILLLLKPFRVGDFIEAQGFSGTVREIQIFATVLTTGDNRRIIIPNNALATGALTNFSAESTRRVQLIIGIGYDDDIDQAKRVIRELVEADPRALRDPAPMYFVESLGDSSVNIGVRVWTASGDFWGVTFDLQEQIKKRFDAEGITIPYPQQELTIRQGGLPA